MTERKKISPGLVLFMMLMSMTAGAMCLNKVAPIVPVLTESMGLAGAGQAGLLVVVTNELFSDGMDYDPDTLAYLDVLARLNRAVAARADGVYEVVCGIPVAWKGEKP